jgi:MYXO-CTERM domain-containing protein
MNRLSIAAALALISSVAAAQDYLDYKMLSSQQNRFPVYVDTRSNSPAGIDSTLMQNAVHRAWDTWNAVQCAFPKVQWMGPTTGTVQNPQESYDSFSVTPVWMLANDADALQVFGNTSLVMAITLPRAYSGVLQTCDIYFNGFAHSWSVDPTTPANTADVETVALHEAGHCLGLGHYFGPSVMEQVVELGESVRSLTQTDVSMLCTRYPLAGESGSPCFADGGCQQTDLKCVPQPTTNGITTNLCTRGCSTGANTQCDLPFTCQASTTFSGFNGACLLPGAIVTAVGRDCVTNPDCGNSVGYCQRPMPASNGQNFWVDGYCTQACEPGQPPCPAGSICSALGFGDRCLQSCRVGLADCRVDYACAQVDAIGTTGVCVPRCYSNSDCANPTQFTCRTCDGLCVPIQNPGGQLGNPCLQDSECGAGQVCRITNPLSAQKQCVQQCSRGCGVCPSGSTCTPAGRGELFCLRDCSGPGTCGPALRCADTQVGRSCLPQCNSQAECPVGQACYLGECITPMEGDGGCGPLQCRPDAGRPIVVVPKDAGTGPGGTGGCGCSSVDPSFGFALLGLITLISRRRSWRTR